MLDDDPKEFYSILGSEIAGASGRFAVPSHHVKKLDLAADPANVRAWAQTGDRFHGVAGVNEFLPPGVYRCCADDRGPYLEQQPIYTDALVRLPDSASEEILIELTKFRSLEDKFRSHGFLFKRGILLWGPAGSGKTAALDRVCDLFVRKDGGIALLADDPSFTGGCIKLIRKIEPTRVILVLLEDLDALVEQHGENRYLALLDGESQVDNVVFVATTNYPERLDKRFLNRPSRFDTVMYIGASSDAAREVYFRTKIPDIDAATLHSLVAASSGMMLAHLRELVVLTCCFEYSIDEACKKIASMRTTPDSAKAPSRISTGFGSKPF